MNTLITVLVICIIIMVLSWIPLIVMSTITIMQLRKTIMNIDVVISKFRTEIENLRRNLLLYIISQIAKIFIRKK